MKIKILIVAILAAFISLSLRAARISKEGAIEKPRMVLTCDPECDDNNSLIRYLLYSSDFETDAIVLSSSEYHWKGDGQGGTQYLPNREYSGYGLKIGPQKSWRWPKSNIIQECLDEYEKAYPNLIIHDKDYPTPQSLRSVYRIGNIDFEGEMSKDTPGSKLIENIFLDNRRGPVFAMAWGGVNTIARALKHIDETYRNTALWDSVYKKVCDKVILCMSGNQDDTYPTYIALKWPDIKIQAGNSNVPLVYHAQRVCLPQDTVYYSARWYSKYITGVGPFAKQERIWGDGKQLVPDDIFDCFGLTDKYTPEQLLKMGYVEIHPANPTGSFLGEGDTYNYLNMIDNGLRAWQNLTWGGWDGFTLSVTQKKHLSGEYIHSKAPAKASVYSGDVMKKVMSSMFEIPSKIFPDFVPAVQNGLAARFAWSATNDYRKANHYPIVKGPLDMVGKPGQELQIKTQVSDPDGDKVDLLWMQFKVGTYLGNVKISNIHKKQIVVRIPADAKSGQTIHLVLQVTDHGKIPLTRYLRTVITVQ